MNKSVSGRVPWLLSAAAAALAAAALRCWQLSSAFEPSGLAAPGAQASVILVCVLFMTSAWFILLAMYQPLTKRPMTLGQAHRWDLVFLDAGDPVYPALAVLAAFLALTAVPVLLPVGLAQWQHYRELLAALKQGLDVQLPSNNGMLTIATGVGALLSALGLLQMGRDGLRPGKRGKGGFSAALPGVLLGLFAVAVLYKTLGNAVPEIKATLGGSHPGVVWTFCVVFFGLCVLAGFWLNGKSFKGYTDLLRDTGHKADFVGKYGPGLALMNFGFYGLMILAYYIFVNAIRGDALAGFNAVTIGIVFCMVCFGAAGAHPGNIWPIMAGYVLFSFAATRLLGGVFPVNNQAIMVGLCFASGLAPIAGNYGWWAGILAGGMHYFLVTSIPAIHGGFSLYNGGFTSLVIATILVPQLETFCKTKEQRLAARKS